MYIVCTIFFHIYIVIFTFLAVILLQTFLTIKNYISVKILRFKKYSITSEGYDTFVGVRFSLDYTQLYQYRTRITHVAFVSTSSNNNSLSRSPVALYYFLFCGLPSYTRFPVYRRSATFLIPSLSRYISDLAPPSLWSRFPQRRDT